MANNFYENNLPRTRGELVGIIKDFAHSLNAFYEHAEQIANWCIKKAGLETNPYGVFTNLDSKERLLISALQEAYGDMNESMRMGGKPARSGGPIKELGINLPANATPTISLSAKPHQLYIDAIGEASLGQNYNFSYFNKILNAIGSTIFNNGNVGDFHIVEYKGRWYLCRQSGAQWKNEQVLDIYQPGGKATARTSQGNIPINVIQIFDPKGFVNPPDGASATPSISRPTVTLPSPKPGSGSSPSSVPISRPTVTIPFSSSPTSNPLSVPTSSVGGGLGITVTSGGSVPSSPSGTPFSLGGSSSTPMPSNSTVPTPITSSGGSVPPTGGSTPVSHTPNGSFSPNSGFSAETPLLADDEPNVDKALRMDTPNQPLPTPKPEKKSKLDIALEKAYDNNAEFSDALKAVEALQGIVNNDEGKLGHEFYWKAARAAKRLLERYDRLNELSDFKTKDKQQDRIEKIRDFLAQAHDRVTRYEINGEVGGQETPIEKELADDIEAIAEAENKANEALESADAANEVQSGGYNDNLIWVYETERMGERRNRELIEKAKEYPWRTKEGGIEGAHEFAEKLRQNPEEYRKLTHDLVIPGETGNYEKDYKEFAEPLIDAILFFRHADLKHPDAKLVGGGIRKGDPYTDMDRDARVKPLKELLKRGGMHVHEAAIGAQDGRVRIALENLRGDIASRNASRESTSTESLASGAENSTVSVPTGGSGSGGSTVPNGGIPNPGNGSPSGGGSPSGNGNPPGGGNPPLPNPPGGGNPPLPNPPGGGNPPLPNPPGGGNPPLPNPPGGGNPPLPNPPGGGNPPLPNPPNGPVTPGTPRDWRWLKMLGIGLGLYTGGSSLYGLYGAAGPMWASLGTTGAYGLARLIKRGVIQTRRNKQPGWRSQTGAFLTGMRQQFSHDYIRPITNRWEESKEAIQRPFIGNAAGEYIFKLTGKRELEESPLAPAGTIKRLYEPEQKGIQNGIKVYETEEETLNRAWSDIPNEQLFKSKLRPYFQIYNSQHGFWEDRTDNFRGSVYSKSKERFGRRRTVEAFGAFTNAMSDTRAMVELYRKGYLGASPEFLSKVLKDKGQGGRPEYLRSVNESLGLTRDDDPGKAYVDAIIAARAYLQSKPGERAEQLALQGVGSGVEVNVPQTGIHPLRWAASKFGLNLGRKKTIQLSRKEQNRMAQQTVQELSEVLDFQNWRIGENVKKKGQKKGKLVWREYKRPVYNEKKAQAALAAGKISPQTFAIMRNPERIASILEKTGAEQKVAAGSRFGRFTGSFPVVGGLVKGVAALGGPVGTVALALTGLGVALTKFTYGQLKKFTLAITETSKALASYNGKLGALEGWRQASEMRRNMRYGAQTADSRIGITVAMEKVRDAWSNLAATFMNSGGGEAIKKLVAGFAELLTAITPVVAVFGKLFNAATDIPRNVGTYEAAKDEAKGQGKDGKQNGGITEYAYNHLFDGWGARQAKKYFRDREVRKNPEKYGYLAESLRNEDLNAAEHEAAGRTRWYNPTTWGKENENYRSLGTINEPLGFWTRVKNGIMAPTNYIASQFGADTEHHYDTNAMWAAQAEFSWKYTDDFLKAAKANADANGAIIPEKLDWDAFKGTEFGRLGMAGGQSIAAINEAGGLSEVNDAIDVLRDATQGFGTTVKSTTDMAGLKRAIEVLIKVFGENDAYLKKIQDATEKTAENTKKDGKEMDFEGTPIWQAMKQIATRGMAGNNHAAEFAKSSWDSDDGKQYGRWADPGKTYIVGR